MSELSDYRRMVSDPLERELRAENARLREELVEHRRALWMLAWAAPEHTVFVTRDAAEHYRSDATLKTWTDARIGELMIIAELPSPTEKE